MSRLETLYRRRDARKQLLKRYFGEKRDFFADIDMRPTEKALFEMLLREPHNRPLRLGITVNKLVRDELTYGIEKEGHLIMQILGIQGVGKSTLALKIAKIIQREWKRIHNKDVRIFVTFNFHETIKKAMEIQPGDIIIQDEAPSLAGIESRITAERLENLLAILRANQNSWIFVYPELVKDLINPTLILEVVGRYPEKKWTLAVAYSRLNRCLGWVIFDVNEVFEDEEFYSWYMQRKMENLRRIQQSGGLISATYQEEEIEKVIDKIVQAWEKYGRKEIRYKSDIDKYILLAGVQGSKWFIDQVRALAYDKIMELQEEYMRELESTFKDQDFVVTGEKKSFRKWLYENIDKVDRSLFPTITKKQWENIVRLIKVAFKNAKDDEPVMAQIFVAEQMGLSNYSVSIITKIASEKGVIGALFELWFHKIHGVNYARKKLQGEPDFIHPETNIPYSLKTAFSWIKSRQFVIKKECAPEIEYCRKHNLSYFILAFANPLWRGYPILVKIPIDKMPYAVSFSKDKDFTIQTSPLRRRR